MADPLEEFLVGACVNTCGIDFAELFANANNNQEEEPPEHELPDPAPAAAIDADVDEDDDELVPAIAPQRRRRKKRKKYTKFVTQLSVAKNIFRRLPPITDTIPFEAVQWGESPTYISTQIKENSYLRVIPWNVMNPTQIFVNLFEYWDALEKFQRTIQPQVQVLSREPGYLPKEGMLVPGLILMAYCSVTDGSIEWYRVQIVSADIGPYFNVDVRFLDFGGTCLIQSIYNLCYMRRDILEEFPAQSIEIKMHFSGYNRRIINWAEEGKQLLIKTIDQKPTIGVHFVRKTQHVDPQKDLVWGKDFVWITTLSVLANANDEGHSTIRENVGVINDYMADDIQREMSRRKVRDRKKKRNLPSLATSSTSEQQPPPFLPQAHNAFQISQNNLIEHGEFAIRIEGAVQSKIFEPYIINQRNPIGPDPENNSQSV